MSTPDPHASAGGHAGLPAGGRRPMMGFSVDFAQAPLLVIWEVTRACQLACRHCRASAIDLRDPRELTLDEGKALLERVHAMGTPIMVLTGGDPIQRDDLEDLIRHGKELGLRMGTIPAGTPRLTRERLRSLKEAGVDQVAFSIDAPTAAKHDAFRNVPGSFDLTLQGARWARELDIPLQINTVLSQYNVDDFAALAELVESLGIVFWEVFFLVPTGRGSVLSGCTPEQFEELFGELHRLAERAPFMIKVTEGQHYRRYLAQQRRRAGIAPAPERREAREIKASSDARVIGTSSKVVNAGNGFCFVDHVGDICPSGFLPQVAGNVRRDDIVTVYREHPLFLELRDQSRLTGRCGRCAWVAECGGSRSRAYAVTGDHLADDPACILTR